MRSGGWSPHDGTDAFVKKRESTALVCRSTHWGRATFHAAGRGLLTSHGAGTFPKHWASLYLDLGLGSLHNCKKYISAVYTTQSVIFSRAAQADGDHDLLWMSLFLRFYIHGYILMNLLR